MSSTKAMTALQIIALVSVILGGWALGLNQFSQFIENGREAQLVQAAGECVRFDAPHAVMSSSGEIFCYGIFNGSEKLAPLSYLQELIGEKATPQPGGG